MGRKAQWPPPVYHHTPTDKARCRIWKDGEPHDYTLGPFGSPEAQAAYNRLVAEVEASGSLPQGGAHCLTALVNKYLAYARGYYSSSQYHRVYSSLTPVVALYGDRPPETFGPKALRACLHELEKKHVRKVCNSMLGCMKRAFDWMVAEELLPESVAAPLHRVKGLRRGHCAARESEQVVAVPLPVVEDTLPHLLPPVRAMVWFQLWTGCRPGEAVRLRPADLVRPWRVVAGVEMWVYGLDRHKTDWKGVPRSIAVNPQAQEVIAPYLDRDPEAYCFSPAEAVADLRRRQRAARKTPVQPSQADRSRRAPAKKPGARYTTGTYHQAVEYACKKHGIPHWHPNQLRHTTATLVEARFGRDAARCVLGHTSPQTTAVYAEWLETAALVLARMDRLGEAG